MLGPSRPCQLTLPRIARWLASFIAAWFSLQLLQSKQHAAYTEAPAANGSAHPGDTKPKATRFAGRTLDLTLFAATRAADVIVGELWSQHRARRNATQKWTAVSGLTPCSMMNKLHMC